MSSSTTLPFASFLHLTLYTLLLIEEAFLEQENPQLPKRIDIDRVNPVQRRIENNMLEISKSRYKRSMTLNNTLAEEDTDFERVESTPDEKIPDEQKLMNYLLKSYEKSVRPVKNASSAVLVKMGMTLTQIFDLDEKNQVLITNVWLDQEWHDEFLTWNPEDFNNISNIRIPCTKLWLPDIVLYNNAAEYTDGSMPANAMVSSDGKVFWPVPTKLQSSCKVDVSYFPFDQQICHLKFGSWTYNGFQVDIGNRSKKVDLSNYVKNGEWHLTAVEQKRHLVYYNCCPEPFPDVRFYIKIKRRILYYMYNVVFPCIMMSALTLLVFCLPPDSGEKIALGITVLLAFSVFMLAIAENLPETSEFVPLISIYLTTVMALTSISVIMTVFVLNLHHRGARKGPLPKKLGLCLLGPISKLLCMSADTSLNRHDEKHASELLRKLSKKLSRENRMKYQERENEVKRKETEIHLNSDYEGLNTYSSISREEDHIPERNRGSSKRFARQRSNFNNRAGVNEEILKVLQRLEEHHDIEDTEFATIKEWRKLAQIVDRFLFWFFLLMTIIATFTVLVVLPLTRRGNT